MTRVSENVEITIHILVLVLLIIIKPLLVIWAWNTLFPAAYIPFTGKTWAAAAMLMFIGNILVKTSGNTQEK